MVDVTPLVIVRACPGCGAELPPPHPGGGRPRKWCSQICHTRTLRASSEYAERERTVGLEYRRRKRAEQLAENPLPACPFCGKTVSSHKAITCGTRACQYKLHLSKAAECSLDGCNRPAQARGLCGSHYSAEWARANPDRKSAGAGRYRARKLAAFVEDVIPSDVFERDRWTCHICGKKISRNLKFPDVMSATVDHVIPLSRGGEHSMQNVRAAHMGCNCSKRNGGGDEQLFLF